MGSPMLCYPNYIDSDFVDVIIGGGSWETTLPASNLADPSFNNASQSTSTDADDTRFDVDLRKLRGLRAFALPFHNIRLTGQYRVIASANPKWEGATVDAPASGGASSIDFQAGSTALDIEEGEIFTIEGDETVYKATNSVSISASGTGTVNISPNLADDILAGDEIECHSPDTSDLLLDTGQIDVFNIIYPYGSIDFTHPSWWSGLPTEEQRRNGRFPIVKVFPIIVARYFRFEFFDTTNPDGYVRFPRLFIVPGYQPSMGIDYGANHAFFTDTQVETALGGRRIYNRQPTGRKFQFTLPFLPADEAYANAFDLIQDIGIDRQLFFIFDVDDVALMHRRAFAATLEQLTPLQYPFFDNISAAFELREVIA